MQFGNFIELKFTNLTNKVLRSWFIFNIAINTFFALLFWSFWKIIQVDISLYACLGTWHFIGMLNIAFLLTAFSIVKSKKPSIQVATIAVTVFWGTYCGQLLYALVTNNFSAGSLKPSPDQLMIQFTLYYLFNLMVYGLLFYLEQISQKQDSIHDQEIQQVTEEQKELESRLGTIMGQIEPHFLFNTMSNILTLFETDMSKGKTMMKDLINYLKASSPQIKVENTTLGQEIEMIQAYLNILKIRMGDRLNFRIEVPNSLKDFTFPPMLIQPLVENAIHHGIEPKIEGGEIVIRSEKNNNHFRLEVIDTGIGIEKNRNPDIMLSKIQDRLKHIYGSKGRLILQENKPCGLKAIVEVSYA